MFFYGVVFGGFCVIFPMLNNNTNQEKDSNQSLLFWQLSDEQIKRLEKFMIQFSPPNDVITYMQHVNDGMFERFKTTSNQKYIRKGQTLDRLFNAERVREIIQKNNLKYVAVPFKYIYYKNGRVTVIAEESDVTDIANGNNLNLDEVKDIATFLEKTGFGDFTGDNMWRRKSDNKIIFIDLKDSVFGSGQLQALESFLNKTKNCLSQDAFDWLQDHINYLTNNKNEIHDPIYLPKAKSYDDDLTFFGKLELIAGVSYNEGDELKKRLNYYNNIFEPIMQKAKDAQINKTQKE